MTQVDTTSVDRVLGGLPGYRLDARGREEFEGGRLQLLEQIFDPGSRRRRDVVKPGWRCLEVGAGRGAMAVWLAEQVGPHGRVVATDIDLTYLDRLNVENLEVRRHNILDDPLDALDPGSFDLVCSRFTLFWLPGRQLEAIRRMVDCLRPGGWLIDEDGDWGMAGPVDPSHPLYAGYHHAYQNGGWFADRGYDPFLGRKLSALFEQGGLENIDHQASAEMVQGGSPWARWWRDTLDAIRDWGLAEDGSKESTEQQHDAITAACMEPSVWLMTELLHGCRGQRPG